MTRPLVKSISSQHTTAATDRAVLFDWRSAAHDMAGDWSIRRQTLRGGVSEGVDVIELCNGPLTVSVLPTRGMGIWKADCRAIPVGWNSPVKQPVHPQFVDQAARNGLGWLDGFNELLCRCGLSYVGPPGLDEDAASPIESQITLHGRIANIPAHSVEVGIDPAEQTLWVRGVCDETCLFGPQLRLTSKISLKVGETSIVVHDEIENLGSKATDLSLLYHINVGRPFLEAGAKLALPFLEMAPRDARATENIETWDTYLDPTPGYAEQAYLFDMKIEDQQQSLALLHNASGDRGFSVAFNPRQLPCFTQWKCTQPEADGYVTGLEPGTNYPNFKSFERKQGRIPQLSSGEKYTVDLTLGIHDTSESVTSVLERVASLQSPIESNVRSEPVSPFVDTE
ncbi:MAG: aldose 1-epimerase family protein [Planctomycetaceae bacterium]